MHFLPSYRKVTNFGTEKIKHEKTCNYFEIPHTKNAEVRNTFP